ncbi:MAG: discoidin domain-containing protein, partial [Christensenellaceae bacterium]|nr:discoidin domain-containing protein [Christensenellaceae bacterium]
MRYSKNNVYFSHNFKGCILVFIVAIFVMIIAVFGLEGFLTINTAVAEEYEQGVVNRLVNPAGTTNVLYGPNSDGRSAKNLLPTAGTFNKYDDEEVSTIWHSGNEANDTLYGTKYGKDSIGQFSHGSANQSYFIFDLGEKQWVSKFVYISRLWKVVTSILDFSIYAAPTVENISLDPQSEADKYVKDIRGNGFFTPIIETKESVRETIGAPGSSEKSSGDTEYYKQMSVSGSRNNAPKSLVFTPVYTRYIALVIDKRWRGGFLEIGEAAFYYTTPLKANATEQEKEAYDIYNYYNTSGGEAYSDGQDPSYYGYGGYANYTTVYAPNGTDNNTTDKNIDAINNGVGDRKTFYHTAWTNNSNQSVYGGNVLNNTSPPDNYATTNDAYIIIDLGTTRLVNGITYYPRASGGNGNFRGFKIYINKNPTYPGNENYYISNFTEGDSRALGIRNETNSYFEKIYDSGSSYYSADDESTKEITFDRIYAARYIVLMPTATGTTNAYLSCAELQIKNPGTSINLISSEQSLWNNVSSSGNHTSTFLLTSDITITGKAYNFSGSNSSQASGSDATRLSYERNAMDTAPGSGADDGNWFSGVLLGGMHTITYSPSILSVPANTNTNVRQDANNGDTYHAFLTAHLRGGTLRDINFVLDKKIYLTSYSTDGNRHGNVFGILVGVMDEGAVIDNVNVKINANCGIVAGGDYSGANGARQSWVVGGIVGRIRTTTSVSNKNIIIKNVSLEMGDNSILSADGKDDGNIAYTLASTGGAALVGGIAGLVLTSNNTDQIQITNCMIKSSETSVLHAANRKTIDSYQAVGGVFGSVQGVTTAGGTLSVDGMIVDFRGAMVIYDNLKPFGSTSGAYSAGLFAGHYDAAKITFNLKNIFVSSNTNTKIIASTQNAAGTLSTLSSYNYNYFSGSTTVHTIKNSDKFNASLNFYTNGNPWVGAFTNANWYNSSNLIRLDTGIYTGANLSTDTYSVVYDSITADGLIYMTYKTADTKLLAGYILENTTTLIYEQKRTTFSHSFLKTMDTTKVPKMYDMYVSAAKLTPDNNYSKVYDGQAVSITVAPSTNFSGVNFVLRSGFTFYDYYIDSGNNAQSQGTTNITSDSSPTYVSKNSDVNKYRVVAKNESQSDFVLFNYYNTGSSNIPSHAVTLTKGTSLTVDFTITQKTLTVNFSNTSYTYDGNPHSPTATVSTGVTGQTLNVVLDNAPQTNAGNYTVTAVSLTSSGTAKPANYSINSASDANKTTLSIAKKPLSLSFSQNSFTFDNTLKTVTASVSTGINGQTLTVNLTNNTRTYAGDQSVNFANFSNGTGGGLATNYTTTGPTSTTLTITAKVIDTISWGQTIFDYNGTERTLTASVASGIDGITLGLSITDNKKTHAGNYTAKVSGLTHESADIVNSFNLTATKTKDWEIRKITITVHPKANLSKIYDGKVVTILDTDLDYSGVVVGETIKFTGALGVFNSSSQKNAGSYSYLPGDLNITDNSDGGFYINNYNLSIITEGYTYTINKRPISLTQITAQINTSKTYDASASTSFQFVRGTHYSISGIDDAENSIKSIISKEITGVNFTAQYDSANTDATKINVVFSSLITGSDYVSTNYTYTEKTSYDYTGASINAATLTVTPVSNLSRYYGAPELDLSDSYTYSGQVNGEVPSFNGAIARETGANVKEYNIIRDTLELQDNGAFLKMNYTIDFVSGVVFTIYARVLTITPYSNQGKIYGENDEIITYKITNTIEGETPAFDGALGRQVGSNAADYNIILYTLALKDDGEFKANNYTISFTENIKYTISKR